MAIIEKKFGSFEKTEDNGPESLLIKRRQNLLHQELEIEGIMDAEGRCGLCNGQKQTHRARHLRDFHKLSHEKVTLFLNSLKKKQEENATKSFYT